MTSSYLDFSQRLKRVPQLGVCIHDWTPVVASKALDGAYLPPVFIQPAVGEDYPLTIGVVVRIVGQAFELYQLALDPAYKFQPRDEDQVATLTGEIISHRLFASWTTGVYLESDLMAVIERSFLDSKLTGLATVLVNLMQTARPEQGGVAIAARLVRRNGDVVTWSGNKVVLSVSKALVSVGLESQYLGFAHKVAEDVTARVNVMRVTHITTEEVQNLVEQSMVQVWSGSAPGDSKLFDAIRSYITYRSERTALRNSAASIEFIKKELSGATTEPDLMQAVQLMVTESDGTHGMWAGDDLRARVKFAAAGLDLNLGPAEIEAQLRASLAHGIARSDISKTVNLNAKTLIEKDADFAKFAGRIQLTYIYEEVLGWDILRDGPSAIKRLHQEKFAAYINHAIAIKRVSPKARNFELFKLAEALDPQNDLGYDFLAMSTLYDRYLIIDKTGAAARRLETPQFFLMRVAMGLFLNDTAAERLAIDYYRIMAERRFSPSTPTLFNSMTLHSQLSSCYLYKVDDSLDSIFQRGISDNAQLSKWAGGLGGSWTAVRGTGAHIGGTNGESQGVIPFLKIHNDQLVAVNQGGKRKGSGCAYLETWHNDILEFLELRKNVGDDRRRTHDMNTANWVPDLFMKRMEARQKWTLFRANQVADLHETYGKVFEEKYVAYEKLAKEGKIFGQEIEALDLWKKMLSMLFETGHPWITFKDPCNVRSPQDHAGVIHSSNLCSEICLNTSKEETAVCNLGSVIISNHLLPDGSLNHAKLRETIRLAMRALDNVIDLNFYPTDSARTANLRHRPVGLGVMGLADALYIKNLPFASTGAVEFSDEFMEAVAYYTYEASSDLAAERGTYQSYEGSKWHRGLFPQDTIDLLEQERGLPITVKRGGKMDWTSLRAKVASQGMRNSNCLAIAPTATISNITGCSPCIEPTYKNLFVKSNLSGDFTVLNPYLVRDLKARNLWNEEVAAALKYHDGELTNIGSIPADLKQKYLTAFDIDPKWVIEAAARRSKWIDQAQSLNFWLKTPDLKAMSHLFRGLWHSGAKTSYYLRTLAASNIEKSTVAVKKEVRGVIGLESNTVVIPAADDATETVPKKTYTEAEKTACSIEAMRNGGECESCQ